MSRIKAFRFKWENAWHMIDHGYDTILETSDTGNIIIQFLVNNEPFQLDLSNIEDEFIEDMKMLAEWNKKEYVDPWTLDGTMWSLHFTYDDISIVAKGTNGFPSDFIDFLNILHQKYSVPKAKFEGNDEKWLKQAVKRTKIRNNQDLDSNAMYF